MAFVIDASVAISWSLEKRIHPLSMHAYELLGPHHGLVPVLWWYEVRNILVVNERRGRVSAAEIETILRELDALPIDIDPTRHELPTLELARRYKLTFYDAAYLELARRHDVALATLDAQLVKAARRERVPLVGD